MNHTRRYKTSALRLQNALHKIIATRNISVKVNDICEEAEITRPTFYNHCTDSSDALRQYERELEDSFHAMIPARANRSVVLSLLATFILKHREYFTAALTGYDHFLVTRIMLHYRAQLVGDKVSDSAFAVYMSMQHAIIACWNALDNFNQDKYDHYIAKMNRVRAMEI